MNPPKKTNITFISAGAGSGKTHRLTKLLHEALASETARPSGVLATTFTIKAAAELKERVRKDLLERGEHALANAMEQAPIGTVNSVCGQLLERFSFELGLSNRLRVLDEAAATILLRKTLDATCDPAAARNLADLAYRFGIEDWSSSVAAIVNHARLNDIPGDQLASFGARNAEELLALFPPVERGDPDTALAEAIRSVLPQVAEVAAAKRQKNTLGYLEQLQALQKSLDGGICPWCDWPRLAKSEPQASLRATIAPVAEAASKYASHPRLHQDIRDYLAAVFKVAAEALAGYAAAKRELGAVDFADQEHLLLTGLDHPDVQDVLRDELDLLLVDEFQDTSPLQLALFIKLAAFAKQTYWVGDVKQAIYGFRGSDSALMKAVLDELPQLGGHKEVLGQSWRSRPALVDTVNTLFVPAFEPGLTRAEIALTPARNETGAAAAVMHWALKGSKAAECVKALVGGVQRLIASAYPVQDRASKAMRPARYADIAVLARSNDRVREIAAALHACGIPVATEQPGLLARPECVLALACLRRLSDARDTLATAEILSLADCTEPEVWLADRLDWITADKDLRLWSEQGEGAHPILATLAALRPQLALWSPAQALQAAVTSTGLTERVVRWCADEAEVRVRLANLDSLLALGGAYEDACAADRGAATILGFLLWLEKLAQEGGDSVAESRQDAVRVLTHHGAKGLEWPVVVLHDLDAAVRDKVWGVNVVSSGSIKAEDPLHDRFIRYWPWPFGKQQLVPGMDYVESSAVAKACRTQAKAEAVRLLYVSMTRARDCVVLAVPASAKDMPWLECAGGRQLLGEREGTELVLGEGRTIPFAHWLLDAPPAGTRKVAVGRPYWLPSAVSAKAHPPLLTLPSSAPSISVFIAETAELGPPIDLSMPVAADVLGTASHACFALALGPAAGHYTATHTEKILRGFGMHAAADTTALHASVLRFHAWLEAKWPGAQVRTEVPIEWKTLGGQVLSGQIDVLVETPAGWIVIDHKTGRHPRSDWGQQAEHYGGQLDSYAQALREVTQRPVEETWLHFPLGGAAVRVQSA